MKEYCRDTINFDVNYTKHMTYMNFEVIGYDRADTSELMADIHYIISEFNEYRSGEIFMYVKEWEVVVVIPDSAWTNDAQNFRSTRCDELYSMLNAAHKERMEVINSDNNKP